MALAKTVGEELWRRAQDRREAGMDQDGSQSDRMILPLVLSLARLAAQRDARFARVGSTQEGA